MPSSLDKIRAKVEEVRKRHSFRQTLEVFTPTQHMLDSDAALRWAETALKMAEWLEEHGEHMECGYDSLLSDIAEWLK